MSRFMAGVAVVLQDAIHGVAAAVVAGLVVVMVWKGEGEKA
jgi:hypothetical protein